MLTYYAIGENIVTEYIYKNIPKFIQNCQAFKKKDYAKALLKGILETDTDFLNGGPLCLVI